MPTFKEDLHLGHSVPTIDTEDIEDGAITEKKMADGSVSTRTIQNGAVTEPKIAEKAVTEPKLADAAVSTRTIKFRAVTESKIGDSAVSTRTIQNGAVTNPKIANGAVTGPKLADAAVSVNKLNNDVLALINTGISNAFGRTAKLLLISTLKQVAWTNPNGDSYISALQNALMDGVVITSISAVFDSNATICDSDSLDDLRNYLTVTVTFSDTSTAVVDDYTLSGVLLVGTDTITVNYIGAVCTFTVNVIPDYSSELSNFTPCYYSAQITYADGVLSAICRNQTDADNGQIWTADIKKTLWSTVNGKTLKVRIKVNKFSIGNYYISIYANASMTSLAGGNRLGKHIKSDLTLASDGYYETTVVCDASTFDWGTLTPTSSSTFGIVFFPLSYTESLRIYDVKVYEIS